MTTCIMYLDKDFVYTCSDKRTSLADEYIDSDQSTKTVITENQIFLFSGCPSVRHSIQQEVDTYEKVSFLKEDLKELTKEAGDSEMLVYNRREDTVWLIIDGKDLPADPADNFYAIGSGQLLAKAAFRGGRLGTTIPDMKQIMKIVGGLHLFTSSESDYNMFARITK